MGLQRHSFILPDVFDGERDNCGENVEKVAVTQCSPLRHCGALKITFMQQTNDEDMTSAVTHQPNMSNPL